MPLTDGTAASFGVRARLFTAVISAQRAPAAAGSPPGISAR